MVSISAAIAPIRDKDRKPAEFVYPQHGVLPTLQLCLYFATKQRSRAAEKTKLTALCIPSTLFSVVCEDRRKNKFRPLTTPFLRTKLTASKTFVSPIFTTGRAYIML